MFFIYSAFFLVFYKNNKMQDQCNPFYNHNEGIEEYLKHSLLYTTLELENTICSAREQLSRKDEELMNLKILLTNITKERDEAITKCQTLILEKLQTTKFDNEPPSSSDSDENVVYTTQVMPIIEDMIKNIEPGKPLPEKGKFLQAVMEAGPLLQTLLVAGQLPQWKHPPSHINSIDIPPVSISSSLQFPGAEY